MSWRTPKSANYLSNAGLRGHASYLVFVHRLTDSLHTSFPRSVTLAQLCFTSLAVVSSREDFHLQDCAHAGRTHPPRPEGRSCFVGRFTLLRLVDVSLGRRVPSSAPRPCDKLCLGRLQRYHETRRAGLAGGQEGAARGY